MADQAITALPKKTYSGSSQIASTDYLLGIDSAEGYQMLIQDLGEYIINRATASLAGSTQTLASAISALNSNLTKQTLTMTRTENLYVDSSCFDRLSAYKQSKMLFCNLNLAVSSAISGLSDFVEIGTINNWGASTDVFLNIPGQSNPAQLLLVAVRANGKIEIYTSTGASAGVFFRGSVCIPAY